MEPSSNDPSAGLVDWPRAASIAGRLAKPGPTAERGQLDGLVEELRDAAGRAAGHVAAITKLTAADGADPKDVSRVLVVDRPHWARANAEMFAVMTGGVEAPSGQGARMGGAVQVGGVLALLSSKVLGQFDPFTPQPGFHGRLLLVAPNVLHHERKLKVDSTDFRLWVALHEQTHAMQFAAAPWLAEHLRSRAAELLADLTGDAARSDLFGSVARAFGDGGGGILDALSPHQRTVFDEVGAVMAVLEGHADVTMDEVGRSVVPTVRTIRKAFDARRDEASKGKGLDQVLRRVLGLDVKLAQYRDGAKFVREVRRSVGTVGFNAVFESPENLPLPQEIADPRAWVRRVHA
ncbi:zinc-dependent metalloprotease [Cellulomonas sp. URHE0023]|uniref:zinc-dependent metalloprotease n=1 Tax=Cellulomonas sp. URHE0023 TaxID=1380354 RepID=UPI000483BEC2|nr:zinc-dependent metalloprotease [Cellulomonas sp. URHE0023]